MTPPLVTTNLNNPRFKHMNSFINHSSNKAGSDIGISRAESYKGYYSGYGRCNRAFVSIPLTRTNVVCKSVQI